ncbi:HAMP domain-containing histidine kinase [Candidatus Saccharibacteria bacterium]|nr:HAMP domain-containing histidine kinase [Candidatus Saccharibacteria bacterium]
MSRIKTIKTNPKYRSSATSVLVASMVIVALVTLYLVWNIHKKITPTQAQASLTLLEKLEYLLTGSIAVCLIVITLLYAYSTLKSRKIIALERINAQQSKDELISIASHQLRTPATAVKQYIGMILQGYAGIITTEQQKLLKKAYASNERQLEIVNQMLYIARADAGRLKLQKSTFNINSVIREVIIDLDEIIKSKRQKIKFTPQFATQNIYADMHFIRMVIENLVSNASKYTHEKGKITIETYKHGSQVVVVVEDTGVGISKDDRQKLFKKFSRIPNELSVQAGGSGVGLFLGKILVELHGGYISVDSKLNRGTAFKVHLPITEEENGTD